MFSDHQKACLLRLAEASIRHGLSRGLPLVVTSGDYDPLLAEPGACFVTLHRSGNLRGCIGSLEARRPLATDVAENAFAAAFRDPRFPPLSEREWDGLEIDISVLTRPEAFPVDSEQDLLVNLSPGVDGLVLEERGHRATFLPAVWDSLPEPRAFLDHLRLKAGLPPGYWSDTIQFSRYRTESFGRQVESSAAEAEPGTDRLD